MVILVISQNSKEISPVIHKMDSVHQGHKRVHPSQNLEAGPVYLNFPGLTTIHISYLTLKTYQI